MLCKYHGYIHFNTGTHISHKPFVTIFTEYLSIIGREKSIFTPLLAISVGNDFQKSVTASLVWLMVKTVYLPPAEVPGLYLVFGCEIF